MSLVSEIGTSSIQWGSEGQKTIKKMVKALNDSKSNCQLSYMGGNTFTLLGSEVLSVEKIQQIFSTKKYSAWHPIVKYSCESKSEKNNKIVELESCPDGRGMTTGVVYRKGLPYTIHSFNPQWVWPNQKKSSNDDLEDGPDLKISKSMKGHSETTFDSKHSQANLESNNSTVDEPLIMQGFTESQAKVDEQRKCEQTALTISVIAGVAFLALYAIEKL